MLCWRLLLGTLIVAALAGLGWLDLGAIVPGAWLMPVAVAATVLATREVLALAAKAQLHPLRWAVYCGNILRVFGGWMATVDVSWVGLSWHIVCTWELVTPLCLSAAMLLICLGELWRYQKPGGNMANLAAGVFALLYVGMTLSLAVQMRLLWGVGALASWIIVVKLGDIGAYIVGRLIGRHKMAPRLSPAKTIEGALGSLAFSCLGAWLTLSWSFRQATDMPRGMGAPWGWLAFGLLVGAAGIAGDLLESLLKRDVGQKDSSDWLPGFGGVLDILDSLLLSAPVAWFCWACGLLGG